MIAGVGTDIVAVDRLRRELARPGGGLTESVFRPAELAYCRGRRDPALHLAGRWAAKEAVLKALGTGYAEGIAWTDVEIVRDPAGRPAALLHGTAGERAAGLGVSNVFVSIAHEADYATAVAVLERGGMA